VACERREPMCAGSTSTPTTSTVERLVAMHGRNPDLRVLPYRDGCGAQAREFGAGRSRPPSSGAVGDTFDAAGFTGRRREGGKHAVIYDGVRNGEHRVRRTTTPCINRRINVRTGRFRGDVARCRRWRPAKLAEAIDFIRAVRPARAYSIHDGRLSSASGRKSIGGSHCVARRTKRITPGDTVANSDSVWSLRQVKRAVDSGVSPPAEWQNQRQRRGGR